MIIRPLLSLKLSILRVFQTKFLGNDVIANIIISTNQKKVKRIDQNLINYSFSTNLYKENIKNGSLERFRSMIKKIETKESYIDEKFALELMENFKNKWITQYDLDKIEKVINNSRFHEDIDIESINNLIFPFVASHYGSLEFYSKMMNFIHNTNSKQLSLKEIKPLSKLIENLCLANAIDKDSEGKINELIHYIFKSFSSSSIDIEIISNFALYASLCKMKDAFINSEICSIISFHCNLKREILFENLKNKKELIYLWNFIQSLKLNYNSLYEDMKKNGSLNRLPFSFSGTKISSEQLEISNYLKTLNLHRIEFEKSIGIYTVDIFLNNKCIVEINGFRHYFNDGQRKSGLYQIKYDNLSKMGFDVKEIILSEIKDMPKAEKESYIRRKLGL